MSHESMSPRVPAARLHRLRPLRNAYRTLGHAASHVLWTPGTLPVTTEESKETLVNLNIPRKEADAASYGKLRLHV